MTTPASRLSAALAVLRWSAADVSIECRVNEGTVRRWLKGVYQPPEAMLAWLERLAACHKALPAPDPGTEATNSRIFLLKMSDIPDSQAPLVVELTDTNP